ncbi:ornithine/acetylornithine aminotransferase [Thiovulum sp. ES]|nr:ornithine/acetylornithine aminotransferase [Thiovulum sp. ES]
MTMKSNLLQNYVRFNLEFKKGEGATLTSKSGEKFIDFASGIGVVSLGHSNSEWSEAISEQLKTLTHVSNLYGNEIQEKVARKISELAGFELFSFFANSGAEANEGAIKLARKYGKGDRFEIISLKNSFHGRTLGSLSATGQESLQNAFKPMIDGFKFAENVSEIENLISEKTVAVILELVRGEGGVEMLSIPEVQKLAKTLKEKDILLIVDEVQSGVYRTGEFIASKYFQIEPDIITFAKGLGNGIPIGIVATKLENGFVAGDHGSTFGGNYISSTATLKTLQILEREKATIYKNIEIFEKNISDLIESFPNIFERKTGLGLMRGVVVKNGDVGDIVKKLNSAKVLTLKSGNNTLRFLPPLLISENEIAEGFKRIREALNGN